MERDNDGGESVRVVVRCRPLNTKEVTENRERVVETDSDVRQVLIRSNKNAGDVKIFTYDGVLDSNVSQEQVYEQAAECIVKSVLQGYNGTIFAYGQTGSGKTYTMEGEKGDVGRGIIPRTFEHIFGAIEDSSAVKFLVQASFLEIYNEELHDLLSSQPKTKLHLKESPTAGVYVKDLRQFAVASIEELCGLLEGGHIKVGKLNLVDLAGSERQSKSGAEGDRLKEATKINLSLSALGNVITALVDGKAGHVPYRDSKLTRLLQDSLGGNTKTLMIANIGPADWNYDETLGTLRYAHRAKTIQNKPRINQDPKDAMLLQFQEEIARLQQALKEQEIGDLGQEDSFNAHMLGETELEALRAEVKAQLAKEYTHGPQRAEEVGTPEGAKPEEIAQQADLDDISNAEKAKELQDKMAEYLNHAHQISAEKHKLMEKLSDLQSKILIGEAQGGLEEMTRHRAIELKSRQKDLDEKRRQGKEKGDQILKLEQDQAYKEQVHHNMSRDASEKTQKLKNLWRKVQRCNQECEQASCRIQDEREHLIGRLRQLHQETLLRRTIIDTFIPSREVCAMQSRHSEVKRDQNRELPCRPTSSGFDVHISELKRMMPSAAAQVQLFEPLLKLKLDIVEPATFNYHGSGVTADIAAVIRASFADNPAVVAPLWEAHDVGARMLNSHGNARQEAHTLTPVRPSLSRGHQACLDHVATSHMLY